MKAELNENGVMQIIPETSTEAYAIKQWKDSSWIENNEGYWLGHTLIIQSPIPIIQTINTEQNKQEPIVIETDDWKLGAFVDWQPKNHTEECPTCHGQKEIGGGFKSLDGPRQCDGCFGRGYVNKGPRTPQPEVPKELIEHMRRAWWDFINKK